eukprot:gnl/Hemi2/4782_TR1652_c0_g1_i1.p1 gnl/Hemi2/4782_TR1652_c0_g1~~gnl/Hemi2/4782_TR1652_c0_g1_i1.p1  ORF type:complete len:158 (+),score=25.85 gnl/Hemi2/4782_TR1652_c0_g1_i1:170-643(+)
MSFDSTLLFTPIGKLGPWEPHHVVVQKNLLRCFEKKPSPWFRQQYPWASVIALTVQGGEVLNFVIDLKLVSLVQRFGFYLVVTTRPTAAFIADADPITTVFKFQANNWKQADEFQKVVCNNIRAARKGLYDAEQGEAEAAADALTDGVSMTFGQPGG